jgi:hypothetical protein
MIALCAIIVAAVSTQAAAFSYVMGDSAYAYSSQAQPAKGASYVDSTYNTTVTRVTNTSGDTGKWGTQVEYSTWDPESSDGAYLMFQTLANLSNASSYVVYNAATGAIVRTLTFNASNGQNSEPRWDHSGAHPTWIYYRSNKQLRYIEVISGVDTLVKDFTANFPAYDATYYIWNGDEGTCSDDSRYWGFMLGKDNTHIVRVFTWDKQTDTILGTLDTSSIGGNVPNSVSMSKTGQYIYVAFDWDGSGTWHDRPHGFKNDFTNPVTMCHTIPHGVCAIDAQGNEVYAYLNAYPTTDCIGFSRFDNGQGYECYPQANMGWSGSNVNFSAPAVLKKGWVLGSTYSGSGYGFWSDNQIFMVELDETKTWSGVKPRIWRLSFTQTYTGSSYYYQQPNASINAAGTAVYFGANWRNTSGAEEIYKVDLPATWYSDMGGVAASTWTITGTIRDPGTSPISGVSVVLSGGSTGSASTNAAGYYRFNNLYGLGSYTMTPSKSGFTFSPVSRSTNSLCNDLPNQDFTGAPTYSVSGYVLDEDGSGGDDVTITLSSGGVTLATVKTPENGYYSFSNCTLNSNLTVTPTQTKYTFKPESINIPSLSANTVNAAFTRIYPPLTENSTVLPILAGEARIVGSKDGKGTINPDKGDTAKIYYRGSEEGEFKCKIFTLNGDLVWEQTRDEDEGMFEWIPKHIASGAYVVFINGPGIKVNKKIIIVR